VFIPEEESDSDDEEPGDATLPEPTADETKASFLRLIRERFIYGLLEARGINYLQDISVTSFPRKWTTIKSIGMKTWTLTMIEKPKRSGLMTTTMNRPSFR
jgi:hypothetical protein